MLPNAGRSTWSSFTPEASSAMIESMSVTDFGLVIAIFLPARSLMVLISESGIVTHSTSDTLWTAELTILMSMPSRMAATAAESATSP